MKLTRAFSPGPRADKNPTPRVAPPTMPACPSRDKRRDGVDDDSAKWWRSPRRVTLMVIKRKSNSGRGTMLNSIIAEAAGGVAAAAAGGLLDSKDAFLILAAPWERL